MQQRNAQGNQRKALEILKNGCPRPIKCLRMVKVTFGPWGYIRINDFSSSQRIIQKVKPWNQRGIKEKIIPQQIKEPPNDLGWTWD